MKYASRNVQLIAALFVVGCSQAGDSRLGFIGATATPTQMTMSPAGCAASYLFDSNLRADLRGERITHAGPGGAYSPNAVTEGPPRPGHRHAVGVFTAPPTIAGKPISITVRGFISGVGGTTRISFAGRQSELWTDASNNAPDAPPGTEHTFVAPAVAGDNRFEIDIALPLEGNDPASAQIIVDTVDFRVGEVRGCSPDIDQYDRERRRAGQS